MDLNRVVIDLWPTHGKRVLVATSLTELHVAVEAKRRLMPDINEARRRLLRRQLYQFDLKAPHFEAEHDAFYANVLEFNVLRLVTQGKPLQLGPAPTLEGCAWTQVTPKIRPHPARQSGKLSDLEGAANQNSQKPRLGLEGALDGFWRLLRLSWFRPCRSSLESQIPFWRQIRQFFKKIQVWYPAT
jgi:hypothetical protein